MSTIKTEVMDFKSFKKAINALKTMYDYYTRLEELLNEGDGDSVIVPPDWAWETLHVLEAAFHDEEEWIPYWFFELDCGEKYKDGTICDKEGTNIPLRTEEDLYNVLLKALQGWGDE